MPRNLKDEKRLAISTKNVEIDFKLDDDEFPDNIIFGTVDIVPGSAENYIKCLWLVINNDCKIRFDKEWRRISAWGFETRKNNSVKIVADFMSSEYGTIESEPQTFSIIRNNSSLAPTLYIDRCTLATSGESSDSQASNADVTLIVRWFHVSDTPVETYAVVLDDKEVFHVRDTSRSYLYEARIERIQSDRTSFEHNLKVKARFEDRHNAHESKPIYFSCSTIPKSQCGPIINVSDMGEPETIIPENTPMHGDNPKESPKEPPKEPPNEEIYCGCGESPHKTFPGLSHYLEKKCFQSSTNSQTVASIRSNSIISDNMPKK